MHRRQVDKRPVTPPIEDVRTLLPLITIARATLLDQAVHEQSDVLSTGLLLATKSGAWLEEKALESKESASTLAEIQLIVELHADRMEALAALLRAAETRAQLALMSAQQSRNAYAEAKRRSVGARS